VGERGGPGPTELDTIFHTYVGSNGEGTYKEALEQNEEEYKKCERLYGPMHRDTISKKHNEAFIHAHMGQMDKAEQCMRGIFDACLKELDDETHPCLLATSNKWSLILILRKKYKKAEEYNEIALAGYKSRFGEQNRITLSAKCCRALILDKLGDHEEAEAFYEEAYKGTKFLPDADPDAIFIMYYRALAIHGRDRCGTAGKAYQEALEACEKYLKEHYWGDLNYWEMCLMKDKLQKKAA
jgi:tetratricopeptide (TPR) repeat protein